MARSTKTKTGETPSAASRVQEAHLTPSELVTDNEIARRAYDLYLARECEPGHAVDDWLQAERELREAAHSAPRGD